MVSLQPRPHGDVAASLAIIKGGSGWGKGLRHFLAVPDTANWFRLNKAFHPVPHFLKVSLLSRSHSGLAVIEGVQLRWSGTLTLPAWLEGRPLRTFQRIRGNKRETWNQPQDLWQRPQMAKLEELWPSIFSVPGLRKWPKLNGGSLKNYHFLEFRPVSPKTQV